MSRVVVIGLGKTGLSCIAFLTRQGHEIIAMDTRDTPPNISEVQLMYPAVSLCLGHLDTAHLQSADLIVTSPGVALTEPALAAAISKGVPCVGDIELFLQHATAPVVAITGSNAKSTVTTMMGKVLNACGQQAIVCGNIGMPVLDTLLHSAPDYYVMELSSFQLETTPSLAARVAVVLNVTPDHLDRHHSMEAYLQAKQRVYQGCEIAICNADAAWIWQNLHLPDTCYYFTLSQPAENTFGILQSHGQIFLAFESTPLINTKALHLGGRHYWQNCLTVLAMSQALGLPLDTVCDVLKSFEGLPHRCQFVIKKNALHWYNDSKATNVGACIAALESLGAIFPKQIILIAGGDAKAADLSVLLPLLKEYVAEAIVMGKDAHQFQTHFSDYLPMHYVDSMNDAVVLASKLGSPGAAVLLSPACASYDMFLNYEDRGDTFIAAVERL